MYEISKDRVMAQWNQADGLDTKIFALMGSGGFLITTALAVVAIRADDVPWQVYPLLAGGAAAFLWLVVVGVLAVRLKGFDHGPPLDQAWANVREGYDDELLSAWAAETFLTAYEHNRESIEPKTSAVDRGVWVLICEFVLLAAAILLVAV